MFGPNPHGLEQRFGPLGVEPFGLFLGLGLVLGICVALRRSQTLGLEPETGASALVSAGFFALVGARLFYVLGSPERESFARALALGTGGLSGYGALIAATLGGVWVITRRREPVWTWLDAAAPGALLTVSIARLGCVLAGCDFGAPRDGATSGGFWAALGRAPGGSSPLHPTALYEAGGALLLALGLAWFPRFQRASGATFAVAVTGYAVLRFVVEGFRGDVDRGIFSVLTLTRWCALASVAALACVFVAERRRQRAVMST